MNTSDNHNTQWQNDPLELDLLPHGLTEELFDNKYTSARKFSVNSASSFETSSESSVWTNTNMTLPRSRTQSFDFDYTHHHYLLTAKSNGTGAFNGMPLTPPNLLAHHDNIASFQTSIDLLLNQNKETDDLFELTPHKNLAPLHQPQRRLYSGVVGAGKPQTATNAEPGELIGLFQDLRVDLDEVKTLQHTLEENRIPPPGQPPSARKKKRSKKNSISSSVSLARSDITQIEEETQGAVDAEVVGLKKRQRRRRCKTTADQPQSNELRHHNRARSETKVFEEKKITLYKTELCRSFEETGTCKFGDKCLFAHGDDEIRNIKRHPRYKTEVCKSFWENGVCKYGRRCCFLHDQTN